MRRRATRAVVFAPMLPFVAAAAFAGCGSSSDGIAEKSPSQILAAAEAAAQRAGSVQIVTTSKQLPGAELSLDLALNEHGGRANLDILGEQLELIRVGNDLYVKTSPAVFERLGVKGTVPPGTWYQIAAGQAPQLAAFTDLAGETKAILSTAGRVGKGRTTTIDGQPAVALTTEGRLYKGVLYVKTTGEPLPLVLEKHGRETSYTSFTDWGDQIDVARPAKTMTSASSR